jgi:hypothetical protein
MIRAMTQCRVRSTMVLLTMLSAASCSAKDFGAPDATITANAESHALWNQKLKQAVPAGIALDSAFAVLRPSGFVCSDSDKDGHATCQKSAGIDVGGIGEIRQWRADFWVKGGRISAVRGYYEQRR